MVKPGALGNWWAWEAQSRPLASPEVVAHHQDSGLQTLRSGTAILSPNSALKMTRCGSLTEREALASCKTPFTHEAEARSNCDFIMPALQVCYYLPNHVPRTFSSFQLNPPEFILPFCQTPKCG